MRTPLQEKDDNHNTKNQFHEIRKRFKKIKVSKKNINFQFMTRLSSNTDTLSGQINQIIQQESPEKSRVNSSSESNTF